MEAVVDNPEMLLRPGYFASARLYQPGGAEAIAVPQTAVKREAEVSKVFVVRDNGIVREQIVSTGETLGDRIEITNGLEKGTTIVVEAASAFDGLQVAR